MKQAATCGNGQLEGSEQCDDGGLGGCTLDCSSNTVGFLCVNLTGAVSNCSTTCGDGIRAYTEACDDGNNIDNDGCSSSSSTPATNCTVDSGYICKDNSKPMSGCTPICGDGIIEVSNNEVCDDYNMKNGDGCSNTCQIEQHYVCFNGTLKSLCF